MCYAEYGKVFNTNEMKTNRNISNFMLEHFNSASLVDAARGYEKQLAKGNKMMLTLAGAMSTAELGKSLAEMIRRDKVHIISCTGANLEEDLMNLVAHSHYKRIPGYPLRRNWNCWKMD